MFKSLTQLIFQGTRRLTARKMKNLKIDENVHRLLKTQAAIRGLKITDLASTILYTAITAPESAELKTALADLKTAAEHGKIKQD